MMTSPFYPGRCEAEPPGMHSQAEPGNEDQGNRKASSAAPPGLETGCFWRLGVLAVLILLVFVFSLPARALAQTTVTSTPAQLTLAGTRGDTETRSLLLSATTPITGLQMIPLDLTRDDGKKVLPRTNIQVEKLPDQIAAQGFVTVPITFDLSQVPSGQFTGSLFVHHTEGTLSI
ncbi:MAG: hypothetical protein L0Y56_16130, partial [Nitrospira sp.]|nr:hypothetical protein [Nitrospira sp.]